ncbi:HPr kinase/phosphorylase [Xanthobacter sp. TB0139]|uniref:HPr kinase/phosphorylase n=1 Tax=Xanthobacter sp. TB0139 TaxID=3459178 RepID=UPI004039D2AD
MPQTLDRPPDEGFAGPSIHASCVAVGEAGILVRGPAGCGKSSFILNLMLDAPRCLPPGDLVADDRVFLSRQNGALWAAPPPVLAGLVEVRGLGIMRFPHRPRVRLTHLVDLGRDNERMPECRHVDFEGVELRQIVSKDAVRAVLMLAAALTGMDHLD